MIDIEHKTGLPSVTVGGGLFGTWVFTLNEAVGVVTIAYFLIQIVINLPKLLDSLTTLKKRFINR